ncbi:hypothetical protein [Methylocapsa aurea]|nr:hypothetical protein [Methylocapsa aurea]
MRRTAQAGLCFSGVIKKSQLWLMCAAAKISQLEPIASLIFGFDRAAF